MNAYTSGRRSVLAVVVYELLNPLPVGFFAAALMFDIIYLYSQEIFWTQAASWLIAFGLFLAVIPRLINLVQVWITGSYPQGSAVKIHFWAYLIAVVLAIFNAFIHSRDAWAVVPTGVILSALTVIVLVIAHLQQVLRDRV